ncbi:MAG TPA: phosphoadenylyl-sulfate reductase [Xanthobacteraceae bacterium]|jgi:phosphoadenylyl-sulfate reductase (thioredoxin)|nr:phosphoadenylyl-sulfate reductase [Xanthobacteraceae bacterium]
MNIHVSTETAIALPQRPLVRIVIVGHVDHGKSTLIGRLLHETGSLPDGKLESLKAVSARRGMPFEWSFLLDSLQTERDQGITIDTSQIRFRTPSRDILLIDAPGHAEFLRNMITGAAQADAAILIVDATEGVRDQTRRHGYLLHLLGVRQVAVVVNKMDRVDYEAGRFHDIAREITGYLNGLGVTPTAVIPISARHGDGVARRSPDIAWHEGPAVLEALDQFSPARHPLDLTLRMPVQAIYKFDERRIIAGRVESGRIAVGDEVRIMPGAKFAVVKSIEAWPVPNEARTPSQAGAGQSVGITLDRELFIERGNVLSPASAPASAGRSIRARVFWLDQAPLAVGTPLVVRLGTAETRGIVSAIDKAVDPGHLAPQTAATIGQNHVGEIEVSLAQALAGDPHAVNPFTGRIVLELDGRIAGGGLVLAIQSSSASQPQGGTRSGEAGESLAARVAQLAPRFAALPPAGRLALLRDEIDGRIVFTTSFGIEDQAILHMIHERGLDIDVVTLDTGRLFPETYELWAQTERHFGRRIRAVHPRHDELERLVERQGINGFYASREARMACCLVRKVEPLDRALNGAGAWIVGLRADQSANRQDMGLITADANRNLAKLSPLFDWTRLGVADFVSAHAIPINSLHAKGFVSIGCAPCTRAIRPGEPERAGRWWWEDETKKECGLHDRAR